MKFFAFLGLTLLAFSAHSQVLGELKGTGTMKASYGSVSGKPTLRTAECKMAFNIVNDGKYAGIEFSVFECGGLGVWNDLMGTFKVEGDKLVNTKGQVVGSIDQAGNFTLNASSRTTEKYSYTEYDASCNIWGVKRATLNLDTTWNYSFTKRADGGYDIIRKSSADKKVWASERQWNRCPAVMKYKKAKDVTEIVGSVR